MEFPFYWASAPSSIKVYERTRHEQGIQSVQHASVTGDDLTGIFDPRRPFEQRLAEIADLAEHAARERKDKRIHKGNRA